MSGGLIINWISAEQLFLSLYDIVSTLFAKLSVATVQLRALQLNVAVFIKENDKISHPAGHDSEVTLRSGQCVVLSLLRSSQEGLDHSFSERYVTSFTLDKGFMLLNNVSPLNSSTSRTLAVWNLRYRSPSSFCMYHTDIVTHVSTTIL